MEKRPFKEYVIERLEELKDLVVGSELSHLSLGGFIGELEILKYECEKEYDENPYQDTF